MGISVQALPGSVNHGRFVTEHSLPQARRCTYILSNGHYHHRKMILSFSAFISLQLRELRLIEVEYTQLVGRELGLAPGLSDGFHFSLLALGKERTGEEQRKNIGCGVAGPGLTF